MGFAIQFSRWRCNGFCHGYLCGFSHFMGFAIQFNHCGYNGFCHGYLCGFSHFMSFVIPNTIIVVEYDYWFNRLLVKGSVIIIIIIIFAMCDVCFFFISLISRAVVDGEANTVADKVTKEINRVVVMEPYRVRAGELVDKMTIAIIKERQKGLHPWWRWYEKKSFVKDFLMSKTHFVWNILSHLYNQLVFPLLRFGEKVKGIPFKDRSVDHK